MLHVLFGGGVGGMESACVDLVEDLQERVGDQGVLLLSPRSGPVAERVEAIQGVSLFTHPYSGRADFRRAVRKICERQSVHDVLIYMFGLHVWAAAGARRGGAQRIFTCVGNPAPAGGAGLLKNALLAHAGRFFGDGEVACSEYVKTTMLTRYRLPPGRVITIPYWCRTGMIRARAAQQRAEPGLIGMVARLDRIKDHATLISAVALLKTTRPEVRLALAGEGAEKQRLIALARQVGIDDAVDFMGTVTDVPSFLGWLEVFAFATTRDEGFGIALAEALAAGSPIVATDTGPVREVVGDAALLVLPHDPHALAAALLEVLSDAQLRAELAEKALSRSRLYDVSHAASSFLKLVAGR